MSGYDRPKPIPIKERVSMLFLEKGELNVLDDAFVLVDTNGVRTQIPIGGLACIMLEPGTRVSHRAVVQAARVGCLLTWIGEAGVRLYSAGQPGGARSDKLLYQARAALDPEARRRVVYKMFNIRFGDNVPEGLSINQMRGLEGHRVKGIYKELANRYGVEWSGREYDPYEWGSGNIINRCLSSATSCLYGLSEAAILAAGYAPAIGFIHTGKPRSFVYDIADLFKFETVVPAAFKAASKSPFNPERAVRLECRDIFRRTHLLRRIIPVIEEVLHSSNLPDVKEDGVLEPAIPLERGIGDDGHRN